MGFKWTIRSLFLQAPLQVGTESTSSTSSVIHTFDTLPEDIRMRLEEAKLGDRTKDATTNSFSGNSIYKNDKYVIKVPVLDFDEADDDGEYSDSEDELDGSVLMPQLNSSYRSPPRSPPSFPVELVGSVENESTILQRINSMDISMSPKHIFTDLGNSVSPTPFMVMEKAGENLEEYQFKFGERETACRQMMCLVENLHSVHLIAHGDIKPANFVWSDDKPGKVVQLIDFESSCDLTDKIRCQDLAVMQDTGTPGFTRPDNFIGTGDCKDVLKSRDFYALGISIYMTLWDKDVRDMRSEPGKTLGETVIDILKSESALVMQHWAWAVISLLGGSSGLEAFGDDKDFIMSSRRKMK